MDNPTIVHNYDDYFMHIPSFNADNKRNIVVDGVEEHGDVEKEFAESEVIAEGEYEVQAQEQCMMESFRTYTYLDHMNRLVVVSSTQDVYKRQDRSSLETLFMQITDREVKEHAHESGL